MVFVLLLLVLCFPTIKALLIPGAFTSHDLENHIFRQVDIHRLFSEGQFPLRWSGFLDQGWGYPLFNFIYPLPAFLGEFFHLIGFGYVDSVKAVLLISMPLSALGMYLFLRTLFKKNHPFISFVGSVIYLYAPIRFLNLYVTGSVGAALAMAVMPFLFWSLTRLILDRHRHSFIFSAVFIALLILTHNVTALMVLPLTFLYCVCLLLSDFDKTVLKQIILTYVFGFSLAAFFWLPAFTEAKFTFYSLSAKDIYLKNFPDLLQVIYSPWGYGLSHPGKNDGGMSFQVGLTQLAVIPLLLLVFLFRRKTRKEFLLLLFSLFSIFAGIFMVLSPSQFIWRLVPVVQYIQYPFRILIVIVFVISLATALVLSLLPKKLMPIVGIIITFLALYANRNHLNINQSVNKGEQYYLESRATTASWNEHRPKWAPESLDLAPAGKFSVINGSASFIVKKNTSIDVKVELNVTKTSLIRFNQFYFPGWTIYVDRKPVQFDYQNKLSPGTPLFILEPGKYLVEAKLEDTPVRRIGNLVSLTAILTGIIIFFKWQNERT